MIYIESPLYRVKSKKQLKYIFKIPNNKYFKQSYLAGLTHPYIENKNGKRRLIEPPDEDLKAIQKRLKQILSNIDVPDNIFSGVKGRSYYDNAKIHFGNKYIYKLDLTAFFPSTSREKVYQFFRECFQVSPDIADFLTNITTIDLDLAPSENITEINSFLLNKGIKTRNHLISGAPTSQILSYFTNQNMFNALQALSDKNGVTMSVYVDDITFSSANHISYRFKTLTHNIIQRYGFRISVNKTKYYTKYHPKEITGVIIDRKGNPRLTNSLQYKIINESQFFKTNPTDNESRERLQGLVTAARQINPGCFPSITMLVQTRYPKKKAQL